MLEETQKIFSNLSTVTALAAGRRKIDFYIVDVALVAWTDHVAQCGDLSITEPPFRRLR